MSDAASVVSGRRSSKNALIVLDAQTGCKQLSHKCCKPACFQTQSRSKLLHFSCTKRSAAIHAVCGVRFSAPNSYHAAPPHGCVFHALCTNHRLTTRACLLACACVERKTVACGFCLVRPNRMQAAVAALKRPSSSLGLLRQMLEPGDSSFALKMTSPPVAPSEAAKVTATPIVGVVHHTWIHPPSPKPYHPKQRCHSCGLWADKVKGCEHCATRCPNREQARQALIKANSFVIPRGPLGSMPVYGNTPF
jgi:hypothetical protein